MTLYVALCSIILLSLSTFLSFLLGARVKSQVITEVNQQGFEVMHLITQTVRNGRSIQIPSIGTSSSTLSLTTSNALLNPTVFTASGTVFTIKEGTKAVVPLTNSRVKVSTLSFQNISSASSTDKIIRISFVIDYATSSGKSEYTFTKAFSGSATLR
jgi:hypothetical protein